MSEPSGRVIGMLEGVVLVASLSALLLLQPSATHAWTLELADSADVEGTTAKLGDLVIASELFELRRDNHNHMQLRSTAKKGQKPKPPEKSSQ